MGRSHLSHWSLNLADSMTYTFDAGYYWDAASGYMYDPKSSLYYHSSTHKWYRRDTEANEMKEVEGQEQPAEAVPDSSGPSTAAQTAVGELLQSTCLKLMRHPPQQVVPARRRSEQTEGSRGAGAADRGCARQLWRFHCSPVCRR